ncbi:hypothetical protein POV26_08495 [Aequorivita todarodis]|uniref:hypothetical protein n=1 Tax=Aequorivita todarodis TaxID=2036821 RepID=UPI0023505014|nr:hypothetical protein [Aequorivita todarodis]MDC8001073.1 hypothetical protein [Aequorivita todarodis]
MFVQFAIAAMLFSAIIGITVWFFNRKIVLAKTHDQTIVALERAISTATFQINNRNQNLNRYDFQRYNLEEALMVQPEIIILERDRNE